MPSAPWPSRVDFTVLLGILHSDTLGKSAILHAAVVFVVLHLGYKSVADVALVFALGSLFGWIAAKSLSLLGVTLSHGMTNIALSRSALPGDRRRQRSPYRRAECVEISPQPFTRSSAHAGPYLALADRADGITHRESHPQTTANHTRAWPAAGRARPGKRSAP